MKIKQLILAFSFVTSVVSTAQISPTFADARGVGGGAPAFAQPPPPVPNTMPARDVPGATDIDRAALKAALGERRKIVVQRFLAYRNAKVYPISAPGTDKLSHTWLDAYGRLCAAATLVSEDWGREAAINAGKSNVHLKIADAKSGALND
jgi:hypothetical protein